MVEITRVFWKRAVTADGFVLGEVESADLDMNTWQVTSLFVSLSDEGNRKLGFKHPYLGKVMVCLPTSVVQSIEADKVMLKQTINELRSLKQCKE